MKKYSTVIFVLIFTLISTLAFAQTGNPNAEFKIDGNLSEAGFQNSTTIIEGIGGGETIGFAVYVRNVDEFNAFGVDFTWDSDMASFVSGDSGHEIESGSMTVNGREVDLEDEENALGNPTSLGEVDEDGHYVNNYAKLGDTAAAAEWTLIYFAVFETSESFTANDMFEIAANVSVLNAGVTDDLGTWKFYVNSEVDVESKSWGEIKTQFKDF